MNDKEETYSTGCAIEATPKDGGVTWEDVTDKHCALMKRRAEELAASMRKTQEIMKQHIRNMAE